MSKAVIMNTPLSLRWLTVSNVLSLARLGVVPFIIYSLVMHQWHKAFVLFALASVSDLLDGYLARLLQEQTVLGQYLDPLADKVLLLSCFCTFTYVQMETVPLPLWFIVLALIREAIIVCGGICMVLAGKGECTAPTFLGKLTTASYMGLIGWMFVCHFAGWLPCKSFYGAVIFVAGLAAASLAQYCLRGWHILVYSKR